jgi:dipeptidyl aminopeptidase/acylaminoacyl peptidase
MGKTTFPVRSFATYNRQRGEESAMKKKLLCTWISWLLALAALPAAERIHAISIDDYFSLATVSELAVSPDGQQIAYCERRWGKANEERQTSIWLVSTGRDPRPRRLCFDGTDVGSLRWSGDGTRLYCLAGRTRAGEKEPPWDGTTQVWQVGLQGGALTAVTSVAGGVEGLAVAAREDLLFYALKKSAADEDDFTMLRTRFDRPQYGSGKRTVSEIWRLDLRNWRAEKIIDEKRYVREFAVSADGRRLAMISAFDDSVVKSEGESRVDIWEGGKVSTPSTSAYRAGAATPRAWLESLAWSADGQKIAFCTIFDAHPAEILIAVRTGGEWKMERMPRPGSVHVRGYGSPLKWHASGQLFFLAELSARTVVVPADPAVLESLPKAPLPDRTVYDFDIDAVGKTGVYVIGRPDRFPEIYVSAFKPGAAFRRLTSLNPQAENWKLPLVKPIAWTGADGAPVGGILELPPDYQPGTRLPLVVGIHGGPTMAVFSALDFDPYLGRAWLPARGYAVLCPNYRGSTGYGDKFLRDLIGNENQADVADIVTGVQQLVRDGIVDPERIGIMGWSNGGYLTNCLITKKDLPFKLRAASSGAGIVDTVMEWGINDEPAYSMAFKKGLPWETPDIYQKTSPTYGLGNIAVPTLIHVGEKDERCPPGHSRMLYRALKEYTKVPTELVIYPGEPHGLGKLESRRAKMEWELAWFEKYLK